MPYGITQSLVTCQPPKATSPARTPAFVTAGTRFIRQLLGSFYEAIAVPSVTRCRCRRRRRRHRRAGGVLQ